LRIRVHAKISGKGVQGAFDRADLKRVADRIGVEVWIKDLPDGRVEAVFEGEEEAVKRMLSWCCEVLETRRVDVC